MSYNYPLRDREEFNSSFNSTVKCPYSDTGFM